jgi:branched-chain amino acid transport system substrate-binding protein
MLELARDLGLDIVAEGVEDQSTLDELHGLGCRRAQGYLFGKPLPAVDMAAYIARLSEVRADSVNAGGGLLGQHVKLKIVDDASPPERAAANYEKLITTDKVDLVLGPYSSKLTIPSSQVVAKHRYAFLESAGGVPKVFEQHLTNLFFVQPAPTLQQGGVFADYVPSTDRLPWAQ